MESRYTTDTSLRSYNPRPSSPDGRYWSTIGRNCMDFLAFCSQRDWWRSVELISQSIVEALRSSEVGLGAHRSVRALDYGSGFLVTTRSILSELNFQHGIRTIWDYYEPDLVVRDVLEKTAQTIGRGPNESGVGVDILRQELKPSDFYDLVTVIHSGYYFDDFAAEVEYIRRMLKPGGVLLLVRLDPTGGFYLSESLIPDNGLYVDFFRLSRERVRYESMSLPLNGYELCSKTRTSSHVRIPPEVIATPRFVEGMRSLLTRERYSSFVFPEYSIPFASKFRERFGEGKVVDLGDEVAIYRRVD
jgi:SAM-dependent methyltransferase